MKVKIGETIDLAIERRPTRGMTFTKGVVQSIEFSHPLGIKLVFSQKEADKIAASITEDSIVTIRYATYIEEYDLYKFIMDHEIDKQPIRVVI